jgi:ferritin-like metal-binding protein YciE
MCCNYNQKWFEIGQKITQILSTDNCTTANMRCAKNNVAKSEIEIDTEYNCVTTNDLKTLIEVHSNKTEDNIEMLSNKIDENSQKLLDIENLLQVHLNNTGW